MKLIHLVVKNFRTWKLLEISYKDGLFIFIGKNNSGKSNIFRAINFLFDVIKEGNPLTNRTIQKSLWYEENTTEPIQIDAKFLIEDGESLKKLGSRKEIHLRVKVIAKGEGMRTQISVIPTVFSATPPDPTRISGSVSESIGIGIKIALDVLKDKLVFIPDDRGISNENLDPGVDNSLDGRRIKSYLHKLKNNRKNSGKYTEIQRVLNKILPEVSLDLFVESKKVDLFIKDKHNNEDDFDVVIGDCGSGLIDVLIIITNIIAHDDKIFLIEEPEIHLHPEGQRNLLGFLKKSAENKQILIATHSAIFADSTNSNLFLIKKDKDSKLMEIKKEDLRLIKEELHIRPSDSLLNSNTILLVEGPSDQTFLHNIIMNENKELLEKGLTIYPVKGKDKMYNFSKFIKDVVGIPIILLGDEDYKKNAEDILREGYVSEDNSFILPKGKLEDHYPTQRLIEAIKVISEGKITLDEDELNNSPDKFNYVSMKCNEKGINLGKPELAKQVSTNMNLTELDDIFRKVIKRCGINLGMKINN